MEKEIKVGSVVCLRSNPEIKLTVSVETTDNKLVLVFFNNRTGKFEEIIAQKEALSFIA